jgi:hypothetical protein
VIDLLVGLHPREEIGFDVVIGPAQIEGQIGEGLRL